VDVRVITLRYQEGLQGFPEGALQAATAGREVLEAREHFFLHGNVPHLALVLLLGDGVSDASWKPRDPNAPNPEESVPEGLPFLGLRIFPACWRLQRERFLRTRRKFAARQRAYGAGALDEVRLQACATSADGGVRWFGFTNILRTKTDWATGVGAASGSNRVNRGGSWNNNANNCRSANRNKNNPDNRNNNIGFRAASTMPPGLAGSHPAWPVSRASGNKHVRPRAAGSASERRAGAFSVGHGRKRVADA
jgi:hypothetical protein